MKTKPMNQEIDIDAVITDCEIIMQKIECLEQLGWGYEPISPKWDLDSALREMRDAKEKLEAMKK